MVLIGLAVIATGLVGTIRPRAKLLLPISLVTLAVTAAAMAVVYVSVFRAYGALGRQAIVEIRTGTYLLGVSLSLVSRFLLSGHGLSRAVKEQKGGRL